MPPVAPTYIPRNVFWSGGYLRGDLGAHWGVIGSAQATSPFASPTDSHLGNGMIASLGVGIKTKWLRTDVTIDYAAPVTYSGTVAASGDTTAKIQATTALFNGYLDLGTWYRVTPYIGAGVGAAYVHLSDYTSTGAPFVGDTGRDQWKFAWAGMAGVAFPIARNMLIDVGYRYLNIGDVSTGSNATGQMTFKNLAAHEARIGLRWCFDELW
jgi:opacity protein-like surface antigen